MHIFIYIFLIFDYTLLLKTIDLTPNNSPFTVKACLFGDPQTLGFFFLFIFTSCAPVAHKSQGIADNILLKHWGDFLFVWTLLFIQCTNANVHWLESTLYRFRSLSDEEDRWLARVVRPLRERAKIQSHLIPLSTLV